MKLKHLQTIVCLVVLIAGSALATNRHVPGEYPSIQDAIDACQDSDIVIIAASEISYTGPDNRNLKFRGKAITVRSTDPTNPQVVNTTVIDCEGKGRGFVFYMAEGTDSKVDGLTIVNGYGLLGGAIYSYNNSSPLITNCVFKNNSAVFGGGIACANGNSFPVIKNCRIIANSALVGGGGVYLNGSSPEIGNCIISGNVAPDGGAIYSHNAGNPLTANCTISLNMASRSAGAIYCYRESNMTITNSILWNDIASNASEIKVGNSGAATSISISYCDIKGGNENIVTDPDCTVEWGQGNIDLDPKFVNPGHIDSSGQYVEGDYHLLDDSPCIDAGDPDFATESSGDTDIDGDPRVSGAKIDIGADEVASLEAIEADVKVMPRTLNLQSNGQWISCTIQLPDEYSIGDVDADTITLNEQISPAWYKTDEEANKLLIKLDRFDSIQLLKDSEGSVSLTVSGELTDGTKFAGSDTIKVLNKGK